MTGGVELEGTARRRPRMPRQARALDLATDVLLTDDVLSVG